MHRSLNVIKHALGRSGAHSIVALGLAIAAMPSPCIWAQNGKTQTNAAQATLHLTVHVVPVAALPAFPRSQSDSQAAVTYHLPAPPPRMTVTEEIRPLPAVHHSRLRGPHSIEHAVLKTLTVVAR